MKKVLVLYGEQHIGRLVQVNLERQGIEVVVANSPTAALICIADSRPDAVLTDWSMGFLDGTDVFKVLKNNAATKDIPIYLFPAPGNKWGGTTFPQFDVFVDDDDETRQ
jgi:DNA-binding response OmpR family regulator